MVKKLNALPYLGVGISYREHFRNNILNYYDLIDFLEIIADRYLYNKNKRDIDILKEVFSIIPHGLNLSIGSVEGLDKRYVKNLNKLTNHLSPPWVSEHLSFTRTDDVDFGHLTPLPFTSEAVKTVVNNLKILQLYIKQPIILENITYPFKIPGSELSELEFIKEVVVQSGCGILFDVTNLYANSLNHQYDPYEFIAQFPTESIVQLHFTGGHWYKDQYVDSHSYDTPEEVWLLLEETVKKSQVKGIILERDDEQPSLENLVVELKRAREIWRKYNRWH